MTKKLAFALFITFCTPIIFTGCGMVQELFAPRADGSSMEAFDASIVKIKASLTPEEQKDLDKAIAYQKLMYFKDNTSDVIIGGIAGLFDDDKSKNAVTAKVEKDFLKQFDGKTGKQIIRDFIESKDSK